MADKPKTVKDQIAELTENIAKLEYRLQVVGSFAAKIAAQLCRQSTFTRETTDAIVKAIKPGTANLFGEGGAQRQLASQAAGSEANYLEQMFEDYLAGK